MFIYSNSNTWSDYSNLFSEKTVDNHSNHRYNTQANNYASVAQSVVHLTRNEKVACSSQVTSSKKPTTAVVGFFSDRLEQLNATRMSVAGDGLTAPNIYFCLRKNANESGH